MDLLLTVVDTTGAEHDIRLLAEPSADVRTLLDAVRRALPGPAAGQRMFVERTGGEVEAGRTLAETGVRMGDRLLLTGPVAPPWLMPAGMRPAFEVLVTGGPQAGRRLPMAAGASVYLGRDPGCQIVVDDVEVSRRHLHIGAGSRQITVTDLGSSNGTFVDGVRVEGTVTVEPGQVLTAGTTTLTVARSGPATPDGATVRDGRVAFSRPPRVQRPVEPQTLTVPIAPASPPKRRVPLVAAIVPVLLGAGMAFVMGPIMLLMALFGPVMLGVSWWEDKRSGRRDFTAASERYTAELAALTEQAAQAYAQLHAARLAAAPNPADLTARALRHAPDLWERRAADDDFLTVRVGTADLPSRLTLRPESDREPDERAGALIRTYALDRAAPVDADLRTVGVLGVAGSERDALLRWLILQYAILTSPRELAIVVLGSSEEWAWTRWLPHTETMTAGLPGVRTVAFDPEDARAVLQMVDDLVQQRRITLERRGDPGAWPPNVLLVVAGDAGVPRSALSRVLADGPQVGVYAVAAAPTAETLPGECRAIVRTGPGHETSVTVTLTGRTIGDIVVDGVAPQLAADVARRLAPVLDSSAAAVTGDLPRQVLLLDLLGLPEPDGPSVAHRWSTLGDDGLGAPIGHGPRGRFTIDLRRDGPHGLTAGTTGAGKSELLQSMIGSLAATYPASRLTFVLVDYKGGAAFKDCVGLPHTVGFFTDLDAHLARRALISLNAELRRREEILREHGAKDLIELEQRHPRHAPANLLIVIDEFAFLKKELPEFVAGVVDIAQRGRSLGVHLMLATQRPAGVIDDNIRANTNLRIALRVADEGDSNDVLDRPDAARIPKSLPGRGYVRVGHSDISLVQSAYANARTSVGGQAAPTLVTLAPPGSGLREQPAARSADAAGDDRPTDLQRLVAAVRAAHRTAGVPDQPRPWLDALAGHYDTAAIAGDAAGPADDGLAVALGVADLPHRQAQQPWLVDLTELGHLLVYGTAGSGKTQALRTLAAGLSRLDPADVHIYGVDFASGGLRPLTALPQCGGVVGVDEPERVDRLFTMLDGVIAERKRLLGTTGSSSVAEHRRKTGERLPFHVVLLDGYAAFHHAYLNVDRGELVDTLARQIADGRSAGVVFVITADRRNAIPSTLSGAISARLVLRMADAEEYAALGLPMSVAQTELPPGRGFFDGDEVQIAVLGADPSGSAQAAALAALGSTTHPTRPPAVTVLPDSVPLAEVEPGPLRVPVGVSGVTRRVADVDLDDVPVLAVFGPDRSGRSTALSTVCHGLQGRLPGLEAYLLAPRRTPLLRMPGWAETAVGLDACDALAGQLQELVRERVTAPGTPWLVVIDDGEEMADSLGASAMSTLVRRGRDAGLVLVAAADVHAVHRSFGGWLTDLRKAKHGLLLRPEVDVDGELFGLRLPQRASRRFPPGRAYLVRRGDVDYVQVSSS
ncbi:FtsK/SpoIIIE domain-containing protein [Micromonospora eburnea]|uniref:DNA segregation ATPase FtsK/SpoIIIE, S-DNA-T family n=1 Tax=Micromonospora eburnea TaxID=227316 RepID=A0A1C6VAJ5_9ACTN|nr:FtsK/SpoIIIE domain-containing protein [Micromonospora eburnea]SCL63084.1 DNA segregation ATPase FtsK/SpoIIIE, S-DNA-T family [Micromonospora eburnea]